MTVIVTTTAMITVIMCGVTAMIMIATVPATIADRLAGTKAARLAGATAMFRQDRQRNRDVTMGDAILTPGPCTTRHQRPYRVPRRYRLCGAPALKFTRMPVRMPEFTNSHLSTCVSNRHQLIGGWRFLLAAEHPELHPAWRTATRGSGGVTGPRPYTCL